MCLWSVKVYEDSIHLCMHVTGQIEDLFTCACGGLRFRRICRSRV